MRKVLTGTLLGAVAVAALVTPGAVYVAQAQRPVVQPVEYVTVPGPTVTETATERATEHHVDKIIVPLPGPTVKVTETQWDPSACRQAVRQGARAMGAISGGDEEPVIEGAAEEWCAGNHIDGSGAAWR